MMFALKKLVLKIVREGRSKFNFVVSVFFGGVLCSPLTFLLAQSMKALYSSRFDTMFG